MNSENFEGKNLHLIPEVTDWTGAVRGMFANRCKPQYTEESVVLFDEKERNYTGPSLRAESTYSFYDRSSLTGYAHLRQMLQRWVDRLPLDKQKSIVGEMRHKGRGSLNEQKKFNGAFLELFLHEFLNGTGGYVVVEPKIGNNPLDFGVTEKGPTGTAINYMVEATDINVTRDTELESDWNEEHALDILDEIHSPDFSLWVRTEGTLTTTPRNWDLKSRFESLIRDANYDDVRAMADLYGLHEEIMPKAEFQHGNWRITGHLVPVSRERRPREGRFIGIGPAKADTYDAAGKTKQRLYDKAKQHTGVDNLVIALRGDWWLERDHVAEALFGSRAYAFYTPTDPTDTRPLPPAREVQKPDGFWFDSKGPRNENIIGVAVFHSLYPHNVNKATATFYGNPYTDKPLPAWAKEITHTQYRDGKVETVEGILPCFFVKDHEPWQDEWEAERQQGARH